MHYLFIVMGKQVLPKKSTVLSASQLRRMGFEPESPFLKPGKDAHVALGEQIENLERTMKISRWYAVIGVMVLCVALLLFLFGVI
jgi:hypothetical protein